MVTEPGPKLERMSLKSIVNVNTEKAAFNNEFKTIPSYLDTDTAKELIGDPAEKLLLWNRLRHSKCHCSQQLSVPHTDRKSNLSFRIESGLFVGHFRIFASHRFT